MKVLIAYYSETGNTAKVARAIGEEIQCQGYEVHLRDLGEIAPDTLTAYDLVFLGSACHDADLARPVKEILEQIPASPPFKLAGFATHASHTPEGHAPTADVWPWLVQIGNQRAGWYSWDAIHRLLGYFGCQGAPSPPIERFIHSTIVTDEDEWAAYVHEVRNHPDEDDLRKAKEFAQELMRDHG